MTSTIEMICATGVVRSLEMLAETAQISSDGMKATSKLVLLGSETAVSETDVEEMWFL